MSEFLLALGAFLGAHLIPASPRVRARLIARVGRTPYLVAYSVLSLVLLGWLIIAAQRAETVMLWEAAAWQWHLPFLLMPVAAFFFVAGLLAPNPLSIAFRSGSQPGAVIAITRHPIVWAFLLWAIAHIPPNGDLVSVILFGGMGIFPWPALPFSMQKHAIGLVRIGGRYWPRPPPSFLSLRFYPDVRE